MKRIIFLLTALFGLASLSEATANNEATPISGISISNLKMERNGKYLTVDMNVDLTALKVKSNRAVLLTPRLVNGTDSLNLPSIGIYGRTRYYFYVRNGESMLTGKNEMSHKASNKPHDIAYHDNVPYADWMNGAKLTLHRSDYGCCNTVLAQQHQQLARHTEAFFPELVFVRPEAEIMKNRSLSGSAFIDFPVNKTEIYPDYRRNTVELGKIEATIDSVRNDDDVSIVSVWLKGYASPESPYAHNRDLAIGRTESLKKHIGKLYHFADGIIVTDFEPEDWEGLRRYVERSDINHRTEILEMIDSTLDPDEKEATIKRTYPDEYRFLLQYCYPALRHTDYRIDYNIRSYNDVDEIKRILAQRPQNLGLNEFYLVANTHEPGTPEFTDVFETAVRMYPTDEIANLNAANAAIRHGDHEAARRYLKKAGHSAEAVYAQAALAIREQDYTTAATLLKKAGEMGLEKAVATLTEMEERGYTE